MKYLSNQFPVPVKVKPASYTLEYNGINIVLNSPYGVCKSKQINLIKSGTYRPELFRIKPNC